MIIAPTINATLVITTTTTIKIITSTPLPTTQTITAFSMVI
jgi:hypothetical protein